ncbi:MAG: hypothetical protein JSW70_06980 [Syntrophobacterales bacterium]|nr:MAG: hypothetical protein JSW70_06980 [Syntrophobacterales bacterium]
MDNFLDTDIDKRYQMNSPQRVLPVSGRVIRFKEQGIDSNLRCRLLGRPADIVVTMDAGFHNEPREILRLIEKIREFLYGCGWSHKRRDPWIRVVSSRIANFIKEQAESGGYCRYRLLSGHIQESVSGTVKAL